MATVKDECTALRVALERGDWRRLCDPLLDLLLVEHPELWPVIVEKCASQLAVSAADTQLDPSYALLDLHKKHRGFSYDRTALQMFHYGDPGTAATLENMMIEFPAARRLEERRSLAGLACLEWPTPERLAAMQVLMRHPLP